MASNTTTSTAAPATTSFGELVLILGDIHIPDRACKIPAQFKRMLVPNKMQHVICTGNLTSVEQYNELKLLAPNVHIVAGDYDNYMTDNNNHADETTASMFPETKVIQIGAFTIGIVHGHQIVPYHSHAAHDRIQRKLQSPTGAAVDLFITGHTHQSTVTMNHNGNHYCHINPVRF